MKGSTKCNIPIAEDWLQMPFSLFPALVWGHIHHMQCGVEKIEKLMREFPWEGMLERKRDYLVIWDVVSQVKEKGDVVQPIGIKLIT